MLSEDDFVLGVRLRQRVIREGGTIADALLWLGFGFVVLALSFYLSDPERAGP